MDGGLCNTLCITCEFEVLTMGTRSVRLDEEAEAALLDILTHEGVSISDAIKKGLLTYREKSLNTAVRRPVDFFKGFELGGGGYAIGAARDSKKLVRDKLLSAKRKRP